MDLINYLIQSLPTKECLYVVLYSHNHNHNSTYTYANAQANTCTNAGRLRCSGTNGLLITSLCFSNTRRATILKSLP